MHENAITDKSKLVVREGQAAIFVSEGVLSEVFGPGTHALGNLDDYTKLKTADAIETAAANEGLGAPAPKD